MFNFLICVILSVLSACGISIALVEKSNTWPLKKPRIIFQLILRKIYWKSAWVFYCSSCLSFHTALWTDIILFFITKVLFNYFYFFWPLSGFITVGIMWFINEYLNSQHIEIINNIENQEKKNE